MICSSGCGERDEVDEGVEEGNTNLVIEGDDGDTDFGNEALKFSDFF